MLEIDIVLDLEIEFEPRPLRTSNLDPQLLFGPDLDLEIDLEIDFALIG